MYRFIIAILFILSYIQVEAQSPAEYSNTIVGEQRKIATLMDKLGLQINIDINQSFVLLEEIQAQCDESLKKVKALPPYENNTELKNAAIDLFTFYKKISTQHLKRMLQIVQKGDKIELKDVEEIQAIQKDVDKTEKPLDKAFSNAQKKFAKKYKFTIEG